MRVLNRREILLDDGSKIVALEEPEPPGTDPDFNFSNNVYRIAVDGTIAWQIDAGEGVRGRSAFTGLGIDDRGRVMAYRWDGSDYVVDVETGVATFVAFSK